MKSIDNFFFKFCLIVTFFVQFRIFSQNLIRGKVTDIKKQAIAAASIVVIQNEVTIAYAISDEKGFFELRISPMELNLELNVRAIDYRTFSKKIENKTQFIEIILEDENDKIEEIIIKAPPIVRTGDTLSYRVSAFSQSQDRGIEDVLKRIPGIEIGSDGQILYQGKAINKFYIEGLDLLEGKYNLASKNLPHKEVNEVQIFENHQPIKILDSLIFSEQTALNLSLKNEATIIGQAETGIGASPFLWQVNLSPMFFSQKKQWIASYQSNNVGENLEKLLKKLTLNDLLSQEFELNQINHWLALVELNPPHFKENRWLKNNAHLASFNYLQKLKNQYELKVNFSYLNDFQEIKGSNLSTFWGTGDTISVLEQKNNTYFINLIRNNLNIEKNASHFFLKNEIKYNFSWNNEIGNVLNSNTGGIIQNLYKPTQDFSNNFKYIFKFRKQIINFQSVLSWISNKENLLVRSGQFSELLNNGLPYESIQQNLGSDNLLLHHFLSFNQKKKKFSFENKIGFLLENLFLKSNLKKNEESILEESIFKNNLKWKQSRFYTQIQVQFKSEKWLFSVLSPFNFYFFSQENKEVNKINKSFFTIEPTLRLNRTLNKNWNLRLNYALNNQFGNIRRSYQGFLLSNYRKIGRNEENFPVGQLHNLGGGFFYKNPLKVLFLHFLYNFTSNKQNLLYKNIISDDASVKQIAIEQNNIAVGHFFNAKISKKLNFLQSMASFQGSYNNNNFPQIINERKTIISNENVKFLQSLETELTSWLGFEITMQWSKTRSRTEKSNIGIFTNQFYTLQAHFYGQKKHYLSIKSELFINRRQSQKDYLFLDFLYRYHHKQIDFEMHFNNIFDERIFVNYEINAQNISEATFQLRNRQILTKLRFSF